MYIIKAVETKFLSEKTIGINTIEIKLRLIGFKSHFFHIKYGLKDVDSVFFKH